jgi:hypothetical protein
MQRPTTSCAAAMSSTLPPLIILDRPLLLPGGPDISSRRILCWSPSFVTGTLLTAIISTSQSFAGTAVWQCQYTLLSRGLLTVLQLSAFDQSCTGCLRRPGWLTCVRAASERNDLCRVSFQKGEDQSGLTGVQRIDKRHSQCTVWRPQSRATWQG